MYYPSLVVEVGILSPVTFFQRSLISSLAAASRNSDAAHLYTVGPQKKIQHLNLTDD
jgi:hypothetical protein